MASHDESLSTSTELALMFGNFFGVAEAENLSIDTDSSGTATENFDQTPQANIVSGRQTSLEFTNNGTQQPESTTTPNLLADQTQTSTINVNYNGFSTEAQAAFEYAVDIWESLLVSPVPIEIEANWTPLGTGTLGSAGANYYYDNFANAAYTNTWYPSALANSLAGFDLDTTAHDVNANFNSNNSNWYFGTDGNTPTGKTDFVSVVLHELGHGLGFSGSMNYDFNTEQGSWWSQPKIYDHFTVNGSGQKLIDTFPNNSVALGAQLTSDNLYFNGSNAVAANGGTNPKLYAPSIWDSGSSYAHLDEATYGSGSSNALMTPQIGTGEVNHDPGAVTLGIFEDLGWVINAQPQADLWGWDFNVNPEPLDAGDSFNIDFDITNTGGSAGAFDVSFYLSNNNYISTVDHFLGSTTINGLAGNSTGSFTKTLNLPSVNHSSWNLYGDDTYYIGMRVDSGADVTESNETNNSNVGYLYDYDDVVINNTKLADLSGFYFNVTPEPLDAGDSFNIDFDIINTGSSAGAFDVSFYLSSNNYISTVDHLLGSTTINGLAGNSTGSFTKSLNLPSVNHSFWDLYGDDTLFGDRGDDNLFGEAGNDLLFGDRGDDYLFGGTGNDMLFGDRGDDLLIGVELNLANPGLGEVDSLIGGFGADVFQLGDVFSAYYDDGNGTTDGFTDYALITDFDINQDIIELHGSAADYQLATVSPSLPSGIGVFLQSSTPSGQDELIGIVQGESSLNLNDSYFSFV